MAKDFQELTIKDAFMFAAVMNDQEACRQLLERALGFQILEVTIVTEKTMNYHPEYRGVRLDVLAVENETRKRFNVEMQVKSQKDLFKRCRFYHSSMDMDALPTSTDYETLPDCYVIFICDFDPFTSGLYRYTCRMVCEENNESLKDGSYTIFLSTKGKNRKEVPRELVSFLEYVAHPGRPLSDDYTKYLANKIAAIKRDRNWEAKYMLFKEMLRDEREEGRKEGREEGRKEGREEGRKEGREEVLGDFKSSIFDILRTIGEVPEDISLLVVNEKSGSVLREMIQWAIEAKSFDDFRNQF